MTKSLKNDLKYNFILQIIKAVKVTPFFIGFTFMGISIEQMLCGKYMEKQTLVWLSLGIIRNRNQECRVS